MPVSLSRRHFLKSSAAAALVIGSGTHALARNRHADEFVDYDATGLADLIRAGDINQAELVEVVIRRIEALDPILNFMTTPAFERARETAGTIPDETAFAGVPILIKDMVDVAGLLDRARGVEAQEPTGEVELVDGVAEDRAAAVVPAIEPPPPRAVRRAGSGPAPEVPVEAGRDGLLRAAGPRSLR